MLAAGLPVQPSVRILPPRRDESFAAHVRRGLGSDPKSLPPRFFYDELGSRLFDAICALPEYHLTRAEAEILDAHAGDVAALMGRVRRVVELGSGSALKTDVLLRALAGGGPLAYVPIDVSESALRASADRMARAHPGLAVSALCAEYEDGLAAVREQPVDGSTLALFLGSSIGNFDPDDAATLLERVRDALGPSDRLLLGADLVRDPEALLRAYDDPLGVTAAFDLNVLGRVNRELGGRFDLRAFRHVAVHDRERRRVEMHLESLRDQVVAVDALGARFTFARGERLHTESSYKHDDASLEELARRGGFAIEARWTDRARRFASCLMAPA